MDTYAHKAYSVAKKFPRELNNLGEEIARMFWGTLKNLKS